MSAALSINVLDGATPALARVIGALSDRRPLHDSIGRRLQGVVRDHLIHLANTRHATAARLGAAPSGHLGRAAEKTSFAADAESATVSIAQPGLIRAFRDVTINARPGSALTIPLVAAAYNQRAYRVPGLFIFKSRRKPGVAFLAKREGRSLVFWYRLVKTVRQKQDRTLLPADDALRDAALAGTRDYLAFLRRQTPATP